MTKIALLSVFTFFSLNVFASADYVGNWCNRFDDFTEVLIIDANDNAKSYSVGNQAGEIVQPQSGYASRGASQFQIVLNGVNIGVVDYSVRKSLFSNKRILTLMMSDGEKQQFNECTVRSR